MELLNSAHPFLVHFPVALLIVYSLLEAAGLFYHDEKYSRFVFIILITGIAFSMAALMTGNREASLHFMQLGGDGRETLERHETFATITVFYYSFILFARWYIFHKKRFSGLIKYLFTLMVLIGIIFIYFTGYYGGELVFKYSAGSVLVK